MCLAPVTLADRTKIACRGCRVCKDNRINDLIGRCAAEQLTANETLSVTLTYRGDTPDSVILNYNHIQRMLWHMRADGLKVRYICAGEYGEQKGRAHWHIILFLYGKRLDQPLDRRVSWKYWPHGHSYFQHPDYRGFRYVMKYALKQENGVKSLSMSKKPPLGHNYFVYELARKIVDRALPIHDAEYAFGHITDRNGAPRRYWLQGRMRELFLEQYCGLWFLKYRSPPPMSDFLLEKYLDPIARKELDLDPARYERDRDYRDAQFQTREVLKQKADFERQLSFRHAIAYLPIAGDLLVVFSDRTAELHLGKDAPCLLSASVSVVAQLQRTALKTKYLKPVSEFLNAKWFL